MILIIHCTIRLVSQHLDNRSIGKFLKFYDPFLKSLRLSRDRSPDCTKPPAFLPLKTILENQARHAL